MKKLLGLLLVFFASVAAAQTPPTGVQKLINQQEVLNDKCRGGSGDKPETWKYCEQRDRMNRQIEAKGWCRGPDDAYGYQKHWVPCRPQSTNAPIKDERETVLLYLENDGRTGKTYPLNWPVVIYLERKCPFDGIANSENMVAATLNTVPHCAGFTKDGTTIITVGPATGFTRYPRPLFALSRINEGSQTATVVQPGFDSAKAWDAYKAALSSDAGMSRPGAPLPPRGSAR